MLPARYDDDDDYVSKLINEKYRICKRIVRR